MKIKTKIEGNARLLSYKEALRLPELQRIINAPLTGKEPEPYAASLASSKEGTVIFVEPDSEAKIKLEMGGAPASNFAFFFIFGENSRASVFVKTKFSKGSSECRGIFLSKGATVDFCALQDNSTSSSSSVGMVARLGEGAHLKFLNSNLGGKEKREGFVFLQEGRGSRCEHFEASLAKESQRFHKNSDHFHLAPDTYSRSVFKYATAGNSQVNVEGKVTIEQSAPGSDTHLLAKSLLLSENSISKFTPMLFVRNSEVAAGHGSVLAPLQEEELFYLRSRGIGENESRLLVLQGFLHELLQKSGMEGEMLSALENEIDASAAKLFARD